LREYHPVAEPRRGCPSGAADSFAGAAESSPCPPTGKYHADAALGFVEQQATDCGVSRQAQTKTLEILDDRITGIYVMRNPDKLRPLGHQAVH
jgi:hypothetical protein